MPLQSAVQFTPVPRELRESPQVHSSPRGAFIQERVGVTGAWREGVSSAAAPHQFRLHIRAVDESLETR